jgi:hypothetical protein
MGKLGNMISVMIGINLLFYLFGLLDNTFTSEIMDLALNPTSFAISAVYYSLGIILTAALAITVASAVFNLRIDLTALASPTGLISLILVNIFFDFVKVITVIWTLNSTVAMLIFAPLGTLYILTLVEWWRGITT